jgi:predicted neutral ceramidase superfamily lipid hydrolase
MFYLLKIVIALVVIIGATELSKKNTTLAAILLAMPIIFFVSFTLIWEESKGPITDQWAYTGNHNVYFARYPFFIFV